MPWGLALTHFLVVWVRYLIFVYGFVSTMLFLAVLWQFNIAKSAALMWRGARCECGRESKPFTISKYSRNIVKESMKHHTESLVACFSKNRSGGELLWHTYSLCPTFKVVYARLHLLFDFLFNIRRETLTQAMSNLCLNWVISNADIVRIAVIHVVESVIVSALGMSAPEYVTLINPDKSSQSKLLTALRSQLLCFDLQCRKNVIRIPDWN